ncbi:MAG: hypothetical protein IJ769_04405 [Clostridia bacterium]|nr:hypothetical protein [Clostridia bacterium]
MKKNNVRGLLIIAIALAIFSVVAFVIPFARTTVFWVSYGFGVLAILFQLDIFQDFLRGRCGREEQVLWLPDCPHRRVLPGGAAGS